MAYDKEVVFEVPDGIPEQNSGRGKVKLFVRMDLAARRVSVVREGDDDDDPAWSFWIDPDGEIDFACDAYQNWRYHVAFQAASELFLEMIRLHGEKLDPEDDPEDAEDLEETA